MEDNEQPFARHLTMKHDISITAALTKRERSAVRPDMLRRPAASALLALYDGGTLQLVPGLAVVVEAVVQRVLARLFVQHRVMDHGR